MKKNYKLTKIGLLVYIILNFNYGFSQSENVTNPPTLQVGLSGLTLNKGDLDAQLIMEIVAEKQSEIKVKLIQNMFLDKLQNSGGTVYNYATNMLKVITEEPNTNIRTRLALENTVNLVFTYAFADYIVNNSDVRMLDLRTSYGISIQESSNINILKNLISSNDENKDCFISLILDISSEVIRNNRRLKELGIMRVSNALSYDALNEYKIAIGTADENKFIEEGKFTLLRDNQSEIIAVYNFMETELNEFINLIGVANYFINEYSFNNDLNFEFVTPLLLVPNRINNGEIRTLRESIQETIANIERDWSNENDALFSEAIKEMQNANDLLDKIEQFQNLSNTINIQSDILFIAKNKVIPLLSKNVKFNAALNNDITRFKNSMTLYANNLITHNQTIHDRLINNENINILKLVSMLYDYDKPKTFTDYINILTELEGLFRDNNINSSLSILNSYVKNNITLKKNEEGKEYLEFNIESFLMRLSKTREDKIRRLQFHFTVGVNSIFFKNPLTLSNGEIIQNYSFVSEKIGLKFKFKNPGDWQPRNIGETYKSLFGTRTKLTPPKEPLFSNYHILLYGSGILYNLTATGTSKDFNYPIIGSGLGITFYNSLDLNLTLGFPIQDNLNFSQNFTLDRSFIGIGFDIQFIEYFNRLSEKRKNSQIQKNLAQQNK